MENIAIIVTICGLILTVLNIFDKMYTNRQRTRQEGAADASTTADLSALRQGNASIMVQLDKMDTKMDSYGERLTRVEESAKSAHHRIDTLERRS